MSKCFLTRSQVLRCPCQHPLVLALMLALGVSHAAHAQQSSDATTLDAITVTARLRAESIQDVPDSIIAFGESDIARAGIDSIQNIADMVPNIIMRKAFRANESNITIRGITSGRQGWPPVAFVVDGVKASSIDAMDQGTLLDIERIEVLKGPQGALYGAGAIGGAINIVTRQPTDYFSGRLQASYANGRNMKLSGGISGPIIDNKLLYSVSGYFNETDGIVKIVDSKQAVDKARQNTGRLRLMFMPNDDLSFDLRASLIDFTGRAPSNIDKISDPSLVDEFDSSLTPGPTRREGLLGYESREMLDVSMKTEANLGFANFQAVLAYLDIDQRLYGSVNYEGGPVTADRTIFGQETFGNAALPGQIIDEFQDLTDNFETWSADVRLTSQSEQRLRWLAGAELMRRESLVSQTAGHLIAPEPATRAYALNRWDQKTDNMWGVYGQLSYDLTEQLELTLAGRYDRDDYRNERIDPENGTIIPVQDGNGNMVSALKVKDSAFTPKVQLSWHLAKEFMTYITYSEGFRFGFFNTGNHALAESTKNYEVGFKSRLFDNMLTLNMAVFHIDYSDQQLAQIIATPPFRVVSNFPETKIDGFELDMMFQATEKLSFSGGVGHSNAIVQDAEHHHAPVTPRWTTNASMQWFEPLNETLDFSARIDYRHQSSMYLRANEVYPIPGKTHVDVRFGVESLDYSVKFFVDNLLNTRQAESLAPFSGGYVRVFNLPRSYGVELRYNF